MAVYSGFPNSSDADGSCMVWLDVCCPHDAITVARSRISNILRWGRPQPANVELECEKDDIHCGSGDNGELHYLT